jgi:hypothetical protein
MLSFKLFPGLSATDSLSLSTDGPIPHELWVEAFAYDRDHPLTVETVELSRIELKHAFGVRLLAFTMLNAIRARGLVEERDLGGLGLTQKQIAEWKQEAMALVLSGNPSLAEFAFQEAA